MTHNRNDIDPFHIGQDATLAITVEDEDGTTVDMTGGDATLTVMNFEDRHTATDQATQHVQKSVGSGIAVDDGPVGELEVTFDPGDTEDLDPDTYWYRVDTTDANGDTVPGAVAGRFEAVRD